MLERSSAQAWRRRMSALANFRYARAAQDLEVPPALAWCHAGAVRLVMRRNNQCCSSAPHCRYSRNREDAEDAVEAPASESVRGDQELRGPILSLSTWLTCIIVTNNAFGSCPLRQAAAILARGE